MKFGELTLLFNEEIQKVRQTPGPTTRFIVAAYNAAYARLKETYPRGDDATAEKIQSLPITQHMRDKLVELSKTKLSAHFKRENAREMLRVELMDYLGIGEKKVKELLAAGLTSIAQLSQPVWFNQLNLDTQMMLKYKPLRRIPYADVAAIVPVLTAFVGAEIVGSFRRKKSIIKDIDIMLLDRASDGAPQLKTYIGYLKRQFGNRIWPYAEGPDRISFFFRPKSAGPIYKADVFRASADNRTAMLWYSTGSKEHNIRIRTRAKKMGLLINQNGIFDIKTKARIDSPEMTEAQLYELVGLKYIEPAARGGEIPAKTGF